MPQKDTGSTWETACRCGLRYCRSGWPADAPPPSELPDPLRYLDEQRALGEELPTPRTDQRLAEHQAHSHQERGREAG
jgi:hypothetical protein